MNQREVTDRTDVPVTDRTDVPVTAPHGMPHWPDNPPTVLEQVMDLGRMDYLPVGGYDADGAQIHRILPDAGIWIIEGLGLSPITGGRYEMICLPVKLHGSDGAAARAILRPIGRPGPGQTARAEAAR
jgi:kynurenine formamidase